MTKKIKLVLLIAVIITISIVFQIWGETVFTLENLQTYSTAMKILYAEEPEFLIALFFFMFVAVSVFLIPVAWLLSIASGFIFPLPLAIAVASLSSTISVTIIAVLVRFFFGDLFNRKYGKRVEKLIESVEENGPYYLFAIRLVPIFPFILVNVAVAFTSMRIWTITWVSMLGMLPWTIIFTMIGKELSELTTLNDVISFETLVLLAIVGVLPLISKMVKKRFKVSPSSDKRSSKTKR